MTDGASFRPQDDPMPSGPNLEGLTQVVLIWVEGGIEYWIRFGRQAHEQILDRKRSVLGFRPHSAFAFVRWAANDFGTVIARIGIVRAVAPDHGRHPANHIGAGQLHLAYTVPRHQAWPKRREVRP